jgi:hypothetical protein
MGSAEIILAHGVWRAMSGVLTLIPYEISVIGASKSGKTTLDAQLTTRGEIRKLYDKDRTHHRKNWLGRYQLPDATKKRIQSDGLAKTIVSRDLGGHIEYHATWLRDMINRNCSSVVLVIDNRHLIDTNNVDNQTALGYLLTALSDKNNMPKGLTWRGWWRAKKYYPKRVVVLANKADEWMSDADHVTWEKGFIARHRVFDVFREDFYRLQAMNVPVYMDAISAKYGWNVQEALVKGLRI